MDGPKFHTMVGFFYYFFHTNSIRLSLCCFFLTLHTFQFLWHCVIRAGESPLGWEAELYRWQSSPFLFWQWRRQWQSITLAMAKWQWQCHSGIRNCMDWPKWWPRLILYLLSGTFHLSCLHCLTHSATSLGGWERDSLLSSLQSCLLASPSSFPCPGLQKSWFLYFQAC